MIDLFICTQPFDQIIVSSFIYYFFSARPFNQKLQSSLIYIFHLRMTIRQKYMIFFISFILCLCTTIQPKIRVHITLFFFVHDCSTKVTDHSYSEFILFLIVAIFYLEYCLYISSATVIPLYFIHYIHRSAAVIFCMLYPWLYEVFAVFCKIFCNLWHD